MALVEGRVGNDDRCAGGNLEVAEHAGGQVPAVAAESHRARGDLDGTGEMAGLRLDGDGARAGLHEDAALLDSGREDAGLAVVGDLVGERDAGRDVEGAREVVRHDAGGERVGRLEAHDVGVIWHFAAGPARGVIPQGAGSGRGPGVAGLQTDGDVRL
jgi:hypothetical protein